MPDLHVAGGRRPGAVVQLKLRLARGQGGDGGRGGAGRRAGHRLAIGRDPVAAPAGPCGMQKRMPADNGSASDSISRRQAGMAGQPADDEGD